MHIFPRLLLPLALVLAGLSVLTPARAAAPAGAAPLPHVQHRLIAGKTLSIVAFGSSSTEGVGASSKANSYPSKLQTALQPMLPAGATVVVANQGIGGEDVDDMMRRLPGIVAARPDLVIWQTGSNDPLRDVPLDRFVRLTRDGIAAMQAAGIDVMLMEPQLCQRLADTAGSQRFRDALRALGDELHVPVIRRYELMERWLARKEITAPQLLSPDGLHMADAGYAKLAREVAREILHDSRPRSAVMAAR
jgi:lysophospholipase L1-like esterase